MKILVFSPGSYSIDKTLKQGFEENGHSVQLFDYRKHLKPIYEKINNKRVKLSHSWRNYWENFYFNTINKKHIEFFKRHSPDLVFVYNNEMLLPSTINEFKKSSRVFFFLGDSPFYTPTSIYNLELLFLADQIFCPDTGWMEQLTMLGLRNIHHFIYYSGLESAQKEEVSATPLVKYASDILFVGNNYPGAWGYKRCLFLNQFSDLGLRLYGPPSWKNWFDQFPDLKKGFVPHKNGRLSHNELKILLNCAKLVPVDANPGILNGIHLRVFESIAAGTLPLVEYRKDLDIVFKEVDIPRIYSYKEAKKTALQYITDDGLRLKTIENLRKYLSDQYSLQKAIQQILSFC